MMTVSTKRIAITILAAAALAGCSPNEQAPAQIEPAAPEAQALASPTLPPTAAVVQQVTAQPPTEPAAGPVLPDLGPIPSGDPQLHATNPATVNLSAGRPTLVEFFAFW